jgi:hypothetical protein
LLVQLRVAGGDVVQGLRRLTGQLDAVDHVRNLPHKRTNRTKL